MEKLTGLTGMIAVSLLTLCSSTVCSATGIYAVADQGRTVYVGPTSGIPMILLGLLVWIVPPLVWSMVTAESAESRDNE